MPQLMEPAGDPVTLRALSFFAAVFGVIGQILYVFVDGRPRVWMTIFSVLSFFACAAIHAASESFLALVTLLVGGVVLGFVAELVGDKTGFPFGSYDYAPGMWLQIAGVPLIVPLAWAMMGWPAFVAGRMIGKPWMGAPILAAWDLFLDPQMVKDGRWTWAKSAWPKINGVPLSNFIGWLVVAGIMMVLLDRGVNHNVDFEGIPLMVLVWTWLSSIVGHVLFFGLRGSGIVGGIVMSITMVPVVLVFLGSTRRQTGGSTGERSTSAGRARDS
jgi:uncharacterized membrane protein